MAFRDVAKDFVDKLPKHRDNLFYNTDGFVGPPNVPGSTRMYEGRCVGPDGLPRSTGPSAFAAGTVATAITALATSKAPVARSRACRRTRPSDRPPVNDRAGALSPTIDLHQVSRRAC